MISRGEFVVRAGSGGDGVVSFRREKYVSRGGPDGGDGGRGGNVILMATPGISDLGSLRQRKKVAENGANGTSTRRHGKEGKDLIILVPIGTAVFSKEQEGKEAFVADLAVAGRKILVAGGGRGGLGNANFATATNQAPEIASKGKPGEERYIILKLKLLTDMCIIGHPNSGKSTLLSAISQARPQIADYPFTTREPVLGVMQSDKKNFIIAEMPGLIEGAHDGKGLGNEFLCHVERTKLIVYLLDGTSSCLPSDLEGLSRELSLYDHQLLSKASMVVVNKVDIPQVQARLPEIRKSFGRLDLSVYYISAASGYGLSELITRIMEMLEEIGEVREAVASEVGVFHPKPRR